MLGRTNKIKTKEINSYQLAINLGKKQKHTLRLLFNIGKLQLPNKK